MHNYVYLKEKEFFRPSDIITYNIQLFDLIRDNHQKVLQIVIICCKITKTAHHLDTSPYQ